MFIGRNKIDIRSVEIEDNLSKDTNYIHITTKFIDTKYKMGEHIYIDTYEIYSGDKLILTIRGHLKGLDNG